MPFFVNIKKTARDFALVGGIQTAGLVAIYLITQRGGPLIHNYSYDSFVFGLLAFTAVVGKIFNDLPIKKVIETNSPKFKYFIIFFVFLTFILITNGANGWVNNFRKEKYYYVPVFFLSALIVFAYPLKNVFKEQIKALKKVYWLFFFVLLWWCFSYEIKGAQMVVDKIQFSRPYHVLSKEIVSLGPDVKIWVRAKVNRHLVDDGTERLKLILQYLYLKHDLLLENNRLFFYENRPESFDILMTDSPELIKDVAGISLSMPENSVVVLKMNDKSYKIVSY